MRPGGRIALAFTRYSGQLNQGLEQALIAAGFADAQVKDRATDFCARSEAYGNMTSECLVLPRASVLTW